MADEEFDYGEDQMAPTQDSLRQLGQLGVTMAKLIIKVEDLEEELKAAKAELRKYQEDLVPELMADIGMTAIKTAGGLNIEMKEHVRASFPKDPQKREQAFDYLKKTGNDGLVKREFIIKYGRDSEIEAEHFKRALEEMGLEEHGATVETGWNIHNQTLVKFLKDELKSGAEVPLEAFGAFVQKIAKIKRG